ncbi:hypothetical protein QQF64_004454 [Cirrhinus molitorella]|uniref:Protein kinase domain-containing protein n=1 Tax=Cirrhinus molitorella TaxID=172907 RepID=A0ABR3MJF6_9TELE
MGEGSYGSVYEGTHCEDGLQVAVKITAKMEDEPYIRIVTGYQCCCHVLFPGGSSITTSKCQTSWSTYLLRSTSYKSYSDSRDSEVLPS